MKKLSAKTIIDLKTNNENILTDWAITDGDNNDLIDLIKLLFNNTAKAKDKSLTMIGTLGNVVGGLDINKYRNEKKQEFTNIGIAKKTSKCTYYMLINDINNPSRVAFGTERNGIINMANEATSIHQPTLGTVSLPADKLSNNPRVLFDETHSNEFVFLPMHASTIVNDITDDDINCINDALEASIAFEKLTNEVISSKLGLSEK